MVFGTHSAGLQGPVGGSQGLEVGGQGAGLALGFGGLLLLAGGLYGRLDDLDCGVRGGKVPAQGPLLA